MRPAVQSRLDPQIKAVVEAAWNDAECVLDVSHVCDNPAGILGLAEAVGGLVFQGGGGAFMHLSQGLAKAARASIVDRIGTLDPDNPPRIYEIQSSTTEDVREDARVEINRCRKKAVRDIAKKRST